MALRHSIKFLALLILIPCFFVQADWQMMQQIGTAASAAPEDSVTIAVDPQGNAAVLQLNNTVLQASTRSFNEGWSAPVSLSDNVKAADLAVDGRGNVVAIWRNGRDLMDQTVHTSALGWVAPETAHPGIPKHPLAQISTFENASALWPVLTQFRSFFSNRIANDSNSLLFPDFDLNVKGTTHSIWGDSSQLPQEGSDLSSVRFYPVPKVAVNVDPLSAVLVWTETDTIFSAVYSDGAWVSLGEIPGTAGISGAPDVAVDSAGNAVAVWRQKGDAEEIHGAFLPYGARVWQFTSPLSGSVGDADFPKVSIDGVGNAVAIWSIEISDESKVVQAATLPFQKLVWGPVSTLSAMGVTGTIVNNSTKISVNAAGNAVAAWLFSDPAPSTTAQSSATSIPSKLVSKISAQPMKVTANGSSASSVELTVLDGNGNPLSGNKIVLIQSGSATISPADSAMTDALGQVKFELRNKVEELVSFTASDEQTGVELGSLQVNFMPLADPITSTVIAVPTSVPADGTTSSTITVTARNNFNQLLPDRLIQLTQSGGASSVITPPAPQLTDVAGQAVFTVTDIVAENVTYTATDITDDFNPIVINQQPVVTFTALPTDPDTSTVIAAPAIVQADGVGFSLITVTLRNENNSPIEGHSVSLTGGGDSIITTVSAVTNALGEATFEVRDSTVEVAEYTAFDLTDTVEITQHAFVQFTPIQTDPDNSTIEANPLIVQADGVDFSTLTVTLRNVNNVPVQGHTVQVNGGGSSTILPISPVTNAFGEATFEVRNLEVEVAVYTAIDTTDSVGITLPAIVEFIAIQTDPGNSTVVAVPTSVQADGVASSTITVTLRNVNNLPVEGHQVNLLQNGTSVIDPAISVTNSLGEAVFQVTNVTVQNVTYDAFDITDGFPVIETAQVNFTPRETDENESSVIAVPTTVIADGISFSTITVTLRNVNGVAVPGHEVELMQNGASIITPINSITNNLGEAVFEVSNLNVQEVIYTARDLDDGVDLLQEATVDFIQSITDPNLSTVIADPLLVQADGVSLSTITVILRNANSNPMQGHLVELTQNFGSNSIITIVSDVTNADGEATFTVTDLVPEVVVYTARDQTDNIEVIQPAVVTFLPLVTDPGLSTVIADPTSVQSDGIDFSTITVTLRNLNNFPVEGHTVELTQNVGANSIITVLSAVTNVDGEALFTVRDSVVEAVTYTARDVTDNIVITQQAIVTFVPISTDPDTSTVVAVPTIVHADGISFSTITVTLRNASGIPLQGHTVQLTQNVGGNSIITVVSSVTNANGRATFTVRDLVEEQVTYTATDLTDAIVVAQQAIVNFVPPATDPGNSTVIAIPSTVQADNTNFSTITVTLRNATNTPVEGHTVQLTQNAGASSTITVLSAVTNVNGQAAFTVRNLEVEEVLYTATDLTDDVVITQQVIVNFVALETDPNLSTIVANPIVAIADGVDFSTVTVTLLNDNGVAISNHDVLLGQSGSSTISPLIGTTNDFGEVAFTVRNLFVEVVTYTATDITDAVELTGTAQVTFIPRETDVALSTVVANPTSVFADGVTTSTITVTLLNENQVPVVGHTVSLTPSGGSSIISPPSGPSDANGVVTFTVTNTVVEGVTYTAADLTDAVVIEQTATVQFTPPPPGGPSNFKGVVLTNKFATQKEFTHVLTWHPSVDPTVIGYRLYVNGTLERTIPVSGPYKEVFLRRCDNVEYVYRLVAVSDQGVESAPLFVTLPK